MMLGREVTLPMKAFIQEPVITEDTDELDEENYVQKLKEIHELGGGGRERELRTKNNLSKETLRYQIKNKILQGGTSLLVA
jgi:hypothetical protein